MKRTKVPPIACQLIGLATLMASALHSTAAILYSTGFEDPPFAKGSQLLGQDGWTTAAPSFLNPTAALITDSIARTGSQSLQVKGSDLVSAPEVDPYSASGSYRHPVNYDAGAGPSVVLITSDVRLDGPLLGSGDFFTANIAARSGDGGVGELSISSDGKVYGYTGNFDNIQLASAPITLGEWHNLGIRVDFAADTYSFLVDGSSLGTFPFEAGFTSDVLLRGSAVVYAYPDGVNQRSDFTARYDNFSIASVPEPGSTGGLFLGVVALLAVRHRSEAKR